MNSFMFSADCTVDLLFFYQYGMSDGSLKSAVNKYLIKMTNIFLEKHWTKVDWRAIILTESSHYLRFV